MSEKLYKITWPSGRSCHGGTGKWDLPRDGQPGAWREVEGPLTACSKRALHGCRVEHLPPWVVTGAVVWEMKMPGAQNAADKAIGLRARLVRRVGVLSEVALRLWSADCAERVLPIWTREYPHDTRPAEAIAAARSGDRVRMDKAYSVAASAAVIAAYAADAAYRAAYSAAYSAAYAAYSVAASAAGIAAASAAYREQLRWQGERLLAWIEEG